MINEVWKVIPILENYEISNTGKIRNKITKRIIKTHIYEAQGRHKHKDERLRLYNNKIGKTYKVHRLMAITWFNNFDDSLEVDHLDGDSTNNKLSNLKLCTHKENMNNPNTLINLSNGQKKKHSKNLEIN